MSSHQPFGYNRDFQECTFLAPPYTDTSVQCTHLGKIIENDNRLNASVSSQHRSLQCSMHQMSFHSRCNNAPTIRLGPLLVIGRGKRDCLFLGEHILLYLHINNLIFWWQALVTSQERVTYIDLFTGRMLRV